MKNEMIQTAKAYLETAKQTIPSLMYAQFRRMIKQAEMSIDWAEILGEMAEIHKEYEFQKSLRRF